MSVDQQYTLTLPGNARTFTLRFHLIPEPFGIQGALRTNITDAGHLENDADEGEDKIAKKARLEQLEPMEIVQRYTVDFTRSWILGALPPSIEPQLLDTLSANKMTRPSLIKAGPMKAMGRSIYVDAYNRDGGDYGVFPAVRWMNFKAVRIRRTKEKRNPEILPFGKRPLLHTSCVGLRRGVLVFLDGTLSVLP